MLLLKIDDFSYFVDTLDPQQVTMHTMSERSKKFHALIQLFEYYVPTLENIANLQFNYDYICLIRNQFYLTLLRLVKVMNKANKFHVSCASTIFVTEKWNFVTINIFCAAFLIWKYFILKNYIAVTCQSHLKITRILRTFCNSRNFT